MTTILSLLKSRGLVNIGIVYQVKSVPGSWLACQKPDKSDSVWWGVVTGQTGIFSLSTRLVNSKSEIWFDVRRAGGNYFNTMKIFQHHENISTL